MLLRKNKKLPKPQAAKPKAKETGQVWKVKKANQKGIYFGLAEWFDDEKKLILDFK